MSGIVNGQVGITAETTARLAATLGTTAQYWLNLQNGSTYTRRETTGRERHPAVPDPAFVAAASSEASWGVGDRY